MPAEPEIELLESALQGKEPQVPLYSHCLFVFDCILIAKDISMRAVIACEAEALVNVLQALCLDHQALLECCLFPSKLLPLTDLFLLLSFCHATHTLLICCIA